MEKLFERQETLAIFLLFFVPGFISLKVYDLFVPAERRDFSKSLYEALAYSALNLGVMFWFFDWILSARLSRFSWFACWSFVLIVCPIAWPLVGLWLRKTRLVAGRLYNPNPRAWDSVFQRRESYWVIVHLKDTRRIGGAYSTRSFASSNPALPEIYLEEVWNLSVNGAFETKVDRTAGILIAGDQIQALECFRYP